jgi:MinD-like ATPase involved in chromosome partitioning or flagellar assembly
MSQQPQRSSGAPGRYISAPNTPSETEQPPRELEAMMQPPPVPEIKEPLLIPPDVEPPTMGWPKIKFNRNVKKQKEDPDRPGYVLVPSPSAKELAFRTERDYLALIERSKQHLIELKNERKRAIVIFVNSKGNGATTTSTIWTITGLTIETGCEGWAFDGNFSSGTVAQRLGLEGATISEREFADNLKSLNESHGSLIEYVQSNTDRVRVVGAKETIEGGRKLTPKEYADVATEAFRNCEYLYVDTPNEISGDQCLALLGLADLIVFTANIGEQDSLRQLGTSMETLRNFEVNGMSLRDKVNDSVVLFNNLPPGAHIQDYLKYLHKVNMANEVRQKFPGHVGPYVSIRHDRAMADAQPVNFAALQRETAQDIREFNITVLEQLPNKPRLRELKRSVHPAYSPQSPNVSEG